MGLRFVKLNVLPHCCNLSPRFQGLERLPNPRRIPQVPTPNPKEIVLGVLHDLEADGMAKPIRAESPGGRKTTLWVIHDELGGVAYFDQGDTHLTRLTEDQFHRYRPI